MRCRTGKTSWDGRVCDLRSPHVPHIKPDCFQDEQRNQGRIREATPSSTPTSPRLTVQNLSVHKLHPAPLQTTAGAQCCTQTSTAVKCLANELPCICPHPQTRAPTTKPHRKMCCCCCLPQKLSHLKSGHSVEIKHCWNFCANRKWC